MNIVTTAELTRVTEQRQRPRKRVAHLHKHIRLRGEVVLHDLQLVVLISSQTA